MRRVVLVLVALVTLVTTAALAGCGGSGSPKDGVPESTSAPTSESSTPATRTADPPAARSEPPASPSPSKPAKKRLKGIDASHHQGVIDWAQVADHGIAFAYLKASEGTGFVDPRFDGNRRAALRQGIRVGGYHYFQLCSDGVAQATHFLDVLGDNGGARGLPPAVDLELAGSCPVPPARETLLAEVRAFLDVVEERHGTRPVVYLYPELEERFGFARDLADHPQWVRRLGRTPPDRAWHIWQYDDRGTVPGIAGPADLNLMRP